MIKIKLALLLIFFPIIIFSQIHLGYTEKGKASFYAKKFDGRRTSSGEIFRHKQFTAAHRKFLFHTMIKVTNLSNNKEVILRVNDRGPYSKGRILDLSYSAAKKIGMLQSGVAKVKIEVIGFDGEIGNEEGLKNILKTFTPGYIYTANGNRKKVSGYGVQVSAFQELQNARVYAKALKKEDKINDIYIKVVEYKDITWYRVICGKFKNKERTNKFLKKLSKRSLVGYIVEY